MRPIRRGRRRGRGRLEFAFLAAPAAFVSAYVVFPLPIAGQQRPAPADVPLPQLTEGPRGPLELEIYGPTRELYRIAVPPLGGHATAAQQARDIARHCLRLVGLFRLVDGTAGVGDPDDLGINAGLWMGEGAQGVIKGVVNMEGERLSMTLRLFEVVRGGRPVLDKTYGGDRGSLRGHVHDFINEVLLYYTGVRGIFGSRILFSRPTRRGGSHVLSVGMDGHGMRQWTRGDGAHILPNFGPRGAVFYTAFDDQDWAKLFRSDLEEPVLAEPGLNMGAAMGPGGKMAVVLTRDGNAEIYLATTEGEILARLTHNDAIDVSPAWSPGGDRIAFVSDRDGTPQIYVMGADGSGQTRVTFRGNYNQTPSWCPRCDTPTIAFSGRDGGTFDIFTIEVATGAMKRLTQFQGSNSDPAWSPDGRLIAFYSSRGGIHLMNPEGMNQTRILAGRAETLRWSR